MSKQEIANAVSNIVNDPVTAKVVAAGTIGSGTMSILDLIPDGIGKLATLVGIILSIMLIMVHMRNLKKLGLENKKLELEIAEKERESIQEIDFTEQDPEPA